jgi:broad specificity phosphatase PhoE
VDGGDIVTKFRTLFCARHGETDWNATGRFQGHTDIPLNETGRAQARQLAERLRGERVGAVIASDLARARETGEIVAVALGIPFGYVDADLRERNMGAFEGLTRTECASRFPAEWKAWLADPRNPPAGGEAHAALSGRVSAAAYRAVERFATADATVLAISHGGAMRALVIAVGEATPAPIPNAEALRFDLDGGRLVYVD